MYPSPSPWTLLSICSRGALKDGSSLCIYLKFPFSNYLSAKNEVWRPYAASAWIRTNQCIIEYITIVKTIQCHMLGFQTLARRINHEAINAAIITNAYAANL